MSNKKIDIASYLRTFQTSFPGEARDAWQITSAIGEMLTARIHMLSDEYIVDAGIAIHKTARIENHAVIKAPAIVSKNCFVAAHAYLRGGVFLGEQVVVGPGCELKSSVVLEKSTLAHFNFVGDSIIGAHVNMEAGSVIANHYNERQIKTISVRIGQHCIPIEAEKFGALVGDSTRVGANAVLSPGTLLAPGNIVKRLELVEQCPEYGQAYK